jgi:hypothetical protein
VQSVINKGKVMVAEAGLAQEAVVVETDHKPLENLFQKNISPKLQ